MKHFPIKSFTGIECRFDTTDQDRGTLRRADGILTEPRGAISSGPTWASAWGLSNLAAQIATALAGADGAKVHFVTITRAGHTLLVAWDLAATRARGIWHVAGTGDPSYGSTTGHPSRQRTTPSGAIAPRRSHRSRAKTDQILERSGGLSCFAR